MIAGIDGYSENDNLNTADGSKFDSNSFVEQDGTMGATNDAPNQMLDATPMEPDTSFDAYVPPPDALADGCPGSGQNNQNCTTVDTCCSSHCSEKRKCAASCKAFGNNCGKGECCMGFYCPPNGGGQTCAQCLPKDARVPVDYDTLNFYNEACCSGNSTPMFEQGKGPYAICK